MLFNSIDFAIFLPIVFFIYWFVVKNNLKTQNLFIVLASYLFYGWWDWRFLTLIIFSTLVDFLIGVSLSKEENSKKRKILLWTSICINLGFLGFFKYYNFFLENFISAFSFFGTELRASSLKIILPVGISFYTFQTLSYSIDVYKRKLEPTKDYIAFSAFVSFFPQLVAGPIERATNLLPQFYKKRKFDYSNAIDGLRQILWGLLKKMVIADNSAVFVNLIFANSDDYSGSTLVLGSIFFAFQIYGDFSGYSDIAIGTARLFGINLMQNFNYPYFSRSIAEFWRRWHISLSTWFKDYLYIPLGGSRGGQLKNIRNLFIIFVVSGFWHGAKWTFVIWGALNAVYVLPLVWTKTNRKYLDIVAKGKTWPSFKEVLSIIGTFILFCFGLIIFRANDLSHAFRYFSQIFSKSLFTIPDFVGKGNALLLTVMITIFMMVEWFGREDQYAIEKLSLRFKKPVRLAFYYSIIFFIFYFTGKPQEFFYFQF